MVKQLILCLALFCSPAWATWTLTQVKSNNTCTGATCSVTVTSTGSGHLLVAGILANFTSETISSVTAGACSGAWTRAANTAITGASNGSGELFYCLSSVSGQTSIVITPGSSCAGNNCVAIIWEASSSLGNIALDSGATPSNKVNDTTCTACAGTSLILSGNNDFIAGFAANGGTNTGVTGTGCTNDLSNPSGDGVAHCIASGSGTYPTTWAQSSSTLLANAAAFQESSGGAACTPTLTLMGVGRCG